MAFNHQAPIALHVSDEIVRPILQAEITSALSKAMVNKDALMAAAVRAVLEMKVDYSGNPPQYGGSGHSSWIEFKVREAIQKAAQEAITSACAEFKEKIKETLASQLSRTNSPLMKQFVEAMTGSISKTAESQYRLNITVEAKT